VISTSHNPSRTPMFYEQARWSGLKWGYSRVSDAIDRCLEGICALVNPDHPELAVRMWDVKPNATPFEKLQAAFGSVRDQDAPAVTAAQKGNLIEYFRTLRNERLKESRLFLWEAVGGKGYITKNQLVKCSGNEVAKQFHAWLTAHPESLQRDYLHLSASTLGFNLTHLPPDIQYFSELKILWIDKTALKTLPAQIGKLAKLEILQITENFLEEFPPEIGNLSNLEYLYLKTNKLRRLPSEVGKLTKLEILQITENFLEELPPEVGNLLRLEYLYLNFYFPGL